jgi:NADH:ubiquinone oxidoreductase subunit 4 (subunit M)
MLPLSGAFWLGLLGVISILYGAFNALAQRDLKRMIAYSSVSHMGFVLLGHRLQYPRRHQRCGNANG